MGTMDPTFSPSITDESQRFQQQALKAMGIKAQQLTLKPGYELLEEVVDYKNSLDCKEKRQCDLTAGNDSFTANHGEEPHVVGPLSVGNSLVDAFTMQNYEGLSPGQVAWGKIKTDQQWREVSAVLVGYQDTLFTTPEVAQNVAAPLVSYIRHTLVEQDMAAAPKIILLVGHDSNIASLLVAMRFKPYQLPGQYEETPIGGQLMFQRWHDTKNNRELMKVEYVYQSTAQLRNGEPLSLRHPPQHFTMQLEGCPIDANGFCPWDKFAETFAMT
jgi:glucose-1-phosphatase